ncbi:MAG: type III secretion inner membrane ring lipoprotein SctJ [Simkaniaceae bacterium]|nr:type III secretion inner membrane ring lipoprotein SctJ [Simkaniaceae bacterium]
MKFIQIFKQSNTFFLFLFSTLLLLTGCEKSQTVVSGVDEREANLIIVFLDSKGIQATKQQQAVSAIGGGQGGALKYNIFVEESKMIDAMAILNQNGLPRRQGTTLLELFAKQGLMTTDKEETIRYQAGLEQQIANMILMIDGIIDASVQLSFPSTDTGGGEQPTQAVTAAVYVKHQGILEDPNSHLETKIKRLVSGSVNGLDINNVTVVSDRSRYTDISVAELSMVPKTNDYVRIWSIVMSRESALKFRAIFFTIMILGTIFAALFGWLLWKFYPTLRRSGGLRDIFKIKPFTPEKTGVSEEKGEAPSE